MGEKGERHKKRRRDSRLYLKRSLDLFIKKLEAVRRIMERVDESEMSPEMESYAIRIMETVKKVEREMAEILKKDTANRKKLRTVK